MIVSCANCGKRFKGTPGPRKFKCSGCGNLFTFPETAMAPAEGHVLCSNCWSEMKANTDIRSCPMCSQKLSSNYGGRAVEELAPPPQLEPQVEQEQQGQEQPQHSGHTGLLDRLVQQEQEEQQQRQEQEQQEEQRVIPEQEPQEEQEERQVILEQEPQEEQEERQVIPEQEPEARQDPQPEQSAGEQTGDQATASAEGGEWQTRAEKAEAQAKELEEQINAFREAAIAALEPLVPEVDRLMHSLSDEVAQIQTLVSQARQHLQVTAPPPERLMGLSELQKLESSATELQGRVEAVRATLTARLQEVLGEPEDAPAEEEQLVSG